jgi:hypothetical protein
MQRFAIAFVICLASWIAGNLVKPIVTYDSWQYLSSGLSLASGSFPDGFFLIREPLYPLFLGLMIWLGLPLQATVSVQFMFFFLAMLVIWSIVRGESKPAIRGSIGIFIAFLATGLLGGYAAFLGQQTLLLFLLALGIWVVNRAREGAKGRRLGVYSAFLVGSLFGFTSIFLTIFLSLLFGALVALRILFRERRDSAGLRELGAVAMLLLGAIVAGGGWHVFRVGLVEFEGQVQSEAIVSNGLIGPYEQVIRAGIPPETALLTSFLANLDLAPNQGWGLDILLSDQRPGSPNFFFGSAPWFGLSDPCVKRPVGEIPFVSPQSLAMFVECEDFSPPRASSAIKVGWAAAHLLSSLLLLGGLLLWRRRVAPRVTLLWMSAISFSLGYALLLGGIPRYGMPSQMLLLFLGGLFLSPFLSRPIQMIKHLRAHLFKK